MKRSTERILTTHVGSLARPDDLVPILKAKDRGQPYDRETYDRLVREAVADIVRRQIDAGVDIVTDGEQGKASFYGYILERFNGFSRKPAPPGGEGNTRAQSRDYLAFPDYYAWSERIAEWAGGRGGDRRHGIDVCTGPVSYKGHAAIQADIDNLKVIGVAAIPGAPTPCSPSPSDTGIEAAAIRCLPPRLWRCRSRTVRPSSRPSAFDSTSHRRTLPHEDDDRHDVGRLVR